MLFSNHTSYRVKNVALIFIKVLISFTIYFNSFTIAHAAGLNGWSMSNPISQGASTLYSGMKNVMINGKNVVKTSTALITPTATGVAKLLAKGVGGVALSVAIEQLLGSVDWVLDPANNQIKYRLPTGDILYGTSAIGYYKTAAEYCSARLTILRTSGGFPNATLDRIETNPTSGICWIKTSYLTDFRFDIRTDKKTEEKTIPLPTVASKIISNAENGDSSAKAVTTATAADVVNEAQNDDAKARPIVDQLEANAQVETDDDIKVTPKDPSIPSNFDFKLPAFCGWAPSVCEAASNANRFFSSIYSWIQKFYDTSIEIKENTKNINTKTQDLLSVSQQIRDAIKAENPELDLTAITASLDKIESSSTDRNAKLDELVRLTEILTQNNADLSSIQQLTDTIAQNTDAQKQTLSDILNTIQNSDISKNVLALTTAVDAVANNTSESNTKLGDVITLMNQVATSVNTIADVLPNIEEANKDIKVGIDTLTTTVTTATDELINTAQDTKVNTDTIATATTQTAENTAEISKKLDELFPVFCGWAPVVCEAAQSAIQFPKTVKEWYEASSKAITDYFKEKEPEKENTEVEVQDEPPQTNKVNLSIGDNNCPSMPVSIHTPFETIQSDISPIYLCQIASGMKAFWIAFGIYTASLIVGRRN